MVSSSIPWRSSIVNRELLFCGLRITATITSSKWRAVRSMMSRGPLVTGSNEPGPRAVATSAPVGTAGRGSGDRDHQERIAVGALLLATPTLGELDRCAHIGSFDA